MSQKDSHEFYEDVDAPVPILFWEPIEFVVAVSLIGFGFVTDLVLLGVIAGGMCLALANKLKRGKKRGAVQHWLWRRGLEIDPGMQKHFPSPWKVDFSE